MELAGLEPATSCVRCRTAEIGRFTVETNIDAVALCAR
jgi:hypothetical protein